MGTQRLLTIFEASDRTQLSVSALRAMRHRGEGPPAGLLGRKLFYKEDQLTAWIDAQFEKSA